MKMAVTPVVKRKGLNSFFLASFLKCIRQLVPSSTGNEFQSIINYIAGWSRTIIAGLLKQVHKSNENKKNTKR